MLIVLIVLIAEDFLSHCRHHPQARSLPARHPARCLQAPLLSPSPQPRGRASPGGHTLTPLGHMAPSSQSSQHPARDLGSSTGRTGQQVPSEMSLQGATGPASPGFFVSVLILTQCCLRFTFQMIFFFSLCYDLLQSAIRNLGSHQELEAGFINLVTAFY